LFFRKVEKVYSDDDFVPSEQSSGDEETEPKQKTPEKKITLAAFTKGVLLSDGADALASSETNLKKHLQKLQLDKKCKEISENARLDLKKVLDEEDPDDSASDIFESTGKFLENSEHHLKKQKKSETFEKFVKVKDVNYTSGALDNIMGKIQEDKTDKPKTEFETYFKKNKKQKNKTLDISEKDNDFLRDYIVNQRWKQKNINNNIDNFGKCKKIKFDGEGAEDIELRSEKSSEDEKMDNFEREYNFRFFGKKNYTRNGWRRQSTTL
jgi:hypothetical protein